MNQSSADFSGLFWLRDKSRKTFNVIASTKSVYFNFRFGRGGYSPAAPPPLALGSTPGSHYMSLQKLKTIQPVYIKVKPLRFHFKVKNSSTDWILVKMQIYIRSAKRNRTRGILATEILQHNNFMYFNNTYIRNIKLFLYKPYFHSKE